MSLGVLRGVHPRHPLWIARNNKLIFGPLFLLGALYAAVRWLGKA